MILLLQQELAVARSGQTSDPSAGRKEMAAVFDSDAGFKYGYLTKQSAAWAVLGVNFGNKFQPSSLTQDADSMFVVGYGGGGGGGGVRLMRSAHSSKTECLNPLGAGRRIYGPNFDKRFVARAF